ncbi:MAG: hypothetical protein ACTSYO_00120 [Candidatus Ranarchaeia archaeon]
MGTDVTIKSFDDMLYRRFKAEAIRRGLTVKDAIAEAMHLWIHYTQKSRPRDIIRIEKAIADIEQTRTPSGAWSGVDEIRRWREQRK